MAEEQSVGCGRPTGSVVGEQPTEEKPPGNALEKEDAVSSIMVGRKAPDFIAPAYHRGGFTSLKLSDLLGSWVVLCFYPGDFTFV